MAAQRQASWFLALLVAALLGLAGAAFAQSDTVEPDYARWNEFAAKAEATLDANDASNATLTDLRERMVRWRADFLAAQKVKSTRLATLKDQLSALGPAPAEGETEPDDVSARRKELQDELTVEQAPALRATEAFSRADALVVEIDKAVRARQATAILHRAPSPLSPGNWATAAGDGAALVTGLLTDTGDAWRDAGGLSGLSRPLWAAAALLVLALVLVGVGRHWVDRLPGRITAGMGEVAGSVVSTVASLAQVVLPVAGVWLIVRAIEVSTLTGPWARPFLDILPVAGAIFFSARWLVRQLVPIDPALPAVLGLPAAQRPATRRQAQLLAGIMALHYLAARPLLPLSSARGTDADLPMVPVPFSEAAAGVAHLPFIVLGALALFRLGHLLRRSHLRSDDTSPGMRLLTWVAWLSRIVAPATIIAAAAGYVTAANSFLWPAAITLGLVAFILLAEDFIADLWLLIRRRSERPRDALAPVLIGFALFILAIPVLALIWGARTANLGEWWTRASQGVRIGTVHLSPGAMVSFVVVFMVGFVITRALQGVFSGSILPRTRIDKGGQNAIIAGLGYVGIVLAAVLAITSAGIDFSSIAIVAGALSVGIGFGLQNIVSNFVSGIILLIERPVTVGDWIEVGGAQGTIRRMSVRSTTIQTFDRSDVVVPNSDLITQQVTNWTRHNLTGRIIVEVSVARGSDTRRVAEILTEIAEAQPTVLIDPPPTILFSGFGAGKLDFEMRAILSDINQGLSVSSEIRHQVVERFTAEGIQIAATQSIVWSRNRGGASDIIPAPEPG